MNTTSLALLQTVASSDSTLTPQQHTALLDIIAGRCASRHASGQPLLLTQKEAAKLLSVSRVTLWRMTRDGIFKPVEILPGTFRYRYEEIEALSKIGVVASGRS